MEANTMTKKKKRETEKLLKKAETQMNRCKRLMNKMSNNTTEDGNVNQLYINTVENIIIQSIMIDALKEKLGIKNEAKQTMETINNIKDKEEER